MLKKLLEWMTTSSKPQVTPETTAPADDVDSVKSQIAGLEAHTQRIREQAKWLATTVGALAALLIGTAPLSGVTGLGWDWPLAVASVFGLLTLGALWRLMSMTLDVLAPARETLDDVVTEEKFTEVRSAIARNPVPYLGTWADDVTGLRAQRESWATTLRSTENQLRDPATTEADIAALSPARATALRNLARIGWLSARIEALAENHHTWARFQKARNAVPVVVVLALLGIVGFLTTVGSGSAGSGESDVLHPVRVAVLSEARADLQGLLGPDCPLDGFEALLPTEKRSAPWTLQVTDPDCQAVTVTLTDKQALVGFGYPAAP